MSPLILSGDCLTQLATLDDCSVDAVVTDPPYGLSNTKPDQVADTIVRWATGERDYLPVGRGFMGKAWDGFVPPPAVWDECMRVLKPGGHMLVFAGSRTQDLMGLSIRLAGFEIRDSLAWLYGSGMPKSLDVSKAIDKTAGAERKVVGSAVYGDGHVQRSAESIGYGGSDPALDNRIVTAPATPDAEQWAGWGTALKPAQEPIVCAQKPFNPVHFAVEYDTTHHLIGALTWLSLTPAKRAELTSPSSPHAQPEVTCVSARALVAATSSLDVSAKTATFSSPAQASTLSNIASSWNSILGALSDPTTTSTTSTASSTTTGLRILNSLLAPITSHTTMPACECLQSGGQSSASNAAQSSSDEWARWLHTLSASVPESVIEATATATCHALAAIAETLSQTGQGASESFAPKPAPTDTTTNSGGLQGGIASGAGDDIRPAGTRGGSAPSDARGMRPQNEPIIMARKPLTGTVAANVLEWGTGALNIDASRVGAEQVKINNYSDHNVGITNLGGKSQAGKAYESKVVTGRWPANVLLDPEAAAAMDEQSGAGVSRKGKPRKSKAPGDGYGMTHTGAEYDDSGGASRFFPVFKYQAKAPKKERPVIEREDGTKVQHPTVKPLALMEWLVTLITPPGGVVLDPFAGSGTTLEAARDAGFHAIGIEADPDHVALIGKRLGGTVPDLFTEAA